jgi:hypothetical protein
MARRRRFDTFSLSFLDCMSCGFGAVVLFFMIINATMSVRSDELNRALSLRSESLKIELSEGERNLVELRNTLDDVERREVEAQGLARRIVALLEQKRAELANMEADTVAQEEDINKLKADLKALEEESRRLSAAASRPDEEGEARRGILGDGDRQYLTGLKVGGKRVLLLLDRSASMLDEMIVNVIRRRNMPGPERVLAPKWLRTQRTVEWLLSQLAIDAEFQVIGFNTTARSVVPDAQGEWLAAEDPEDVERAISGARRLVPDGGTSLHRAFEAARDMSPAPDNIILITDGLPTQGDRAPLVGKTVSGRARLRMFRDAEDQLPRGVPVNIILLPMEGDADAVAEYWRLAQRTAGSFISPAKDWP